MFPKMKQYGLDKLCDDEKIALVEEIWDSIDEPAKAIPLTDAQCAELECRLADFEANPDQMVYTRGEVKTYVRAQ